MTETEMSRKILQSPMAQKAAGHIADIYGKSYYGLWMLEAIGCGLDSAVEAARGMAMQAFPQSATWSLPYWEHEYGLAPDPGASQGQRQAAILQKRQGRGPGSPRRMEQALKAVTGCRAAVTEYSGENRFHVTIFGLVDVQGAVKYIDSAKPAHMVYTMDMSDEILCPAYGEYMVHVSGQEAAEITVDS